MDSPFAAKLIEVSSIEVNLIEVSLIAVILIESEADSIRLI